MNGLPMPTNEFRQLSSRERAEITTCRGTKSDRLDHVCGPPDPTIDEQLEFLVRETQSPSRLQLSRHLDENLDTRPSEVELATTVVRKNNSHQPLIICFQGILKQKA